ncbi:MAG: hypothetical protein WHT29_10180 [Bacteroidales bacterium]
MRISKGTLNITTMKVTPRNKSKKKLQADKYYRQSKLNFIISQEDALAEEDLLIKDED